VRRARSRCGKVLAAAARGVVRGLVAACDEQPRVGDHRCSLVVEGHVEASGIDFTSCVGPQDHVVTGWAFKEDFDVIRPGVTHAVDREVDVGDAHSQP
jgi:hypothetical protein